MRTFRCVAVFAFLGLLLGCARGEGEGKTNPVEAVFKDPLTSKQIKGALLKIDDMPSGYTKDPDLISDEDDEDEITSGSPKCKQLMNTLDSDEEQKPFGEGEVGFKESEFGPFVAETVSSFKGDRIKEGMGKFREAFETALPSRPPTRTGPRPSSRLPRCLSRGWAMTPSR